MGDATWQDAQDIAVQALSAAVDGDAAQGQRLTDRLAAMDGGELLLPTTLWWLNTVLAQTSAQRTSAAAVPTIANADLPATEWSANLFAATAAGDDDGIGKLFEAVGNFSGMPELVTNIHAVLHLAAQHLLDHGHYFVDKAATPSAHWTASHADGDPNQVIDISDEPILRHGCPPDDDPTGQEKWCAAVLRRWLYRGRDEGWAMTDPRRALAVFGNWLTGPSGPQSWDWPDRRASSAAADASTRD